MTECAENVRNEDPRERSDEVQNGNVSLQRKIQDVRKKMRWKKMNERVKRKKGNEGGPTTSARRTAQLFDWVESTLRTSQ